MKLLDRRIAISLLQRCYGWLLVLYPAPFRKQYRQELLLLVRNHLEDEYERNGLRQTIESFMWILVDMLFSAAKEHATCIGEFLAKRRTTMVHDSDGRGYEFGRRITRALEQEPLLYPMIVSIEPSHNVTEVAESIALEADPVTPDVALMMFQELSMPGYEDDHVEWLRQLRMAAQQYYNNLPPQQASDLAEQLLFQIYANEALFDLIVSEDIGNGLFTLVQSLALEAEPAETESVLRLMEELKIE